MKLKDLLAKVHLYAEINTGQRISQSSMAKKLGISTRTYSEYLRGGSSPIGMEALIDILSILSDEQILKIVGEWKESKLIKEEEFK